MKTHLARHPKAVAGLASLALALALGIIVTQHSQSYASAPRVQNGPIYAGDQDDTYYIGYRGTAPINLPKGNASLSGTVTDATTGKPVAGVDVGVAHGVMGEPQGSYTKTAANGTWSISGLSGTYNVIASRYEVNGTAPMYKSQSKMGVTAGATVNFALQPVAVPGSRTVPANRAKNAIVVDFDETYEECWFADTKCTSGNVSNVSTFAKTGMNATNQWTTYGWSPIDHYQLTVGSYPDWRTPDGPAKVWGGTEQIDTCIWYNNAYGSCQQTTPEYFLQNSIFDIAKGAGMSTAVIGGNDWPTGHIVNANVDLIQLQPTGTPNTALWLKEIETFFTAHLSNPNGQLIYFPCTAAENFSVESTSPDSSGSLYQNAVKLDDQTFGQLYSWLKSKGYLANTTVAVVGDEAENDHTSYDNFYGNGSTGTGTTRHTPFVLAGPGIKKGTDTKYVNMSSVPPTLMYALGLSGPYDARGAALTSWFKSSGPTPTPTATVPPTATPTPCTKCPTKTSTPKATVTPTPTATVAGADLIVNGGFENGKTGWVTYGSPRPSISTAQAHGGASSLLLGSIAPVSQTVPSYAYQKVAVPSSGTKLTLSWWMYGVSNDKITYAWQEVDIRDSSGTVLKQVYKAVNNDQKWEQVTVDVSPYIGKTIEVYVAAEETSGAKYYCGLYLDDVSLKEQ